MKFAVNIWGLPTFLPLLDVSCFMQSLWEICRSTAAWERKVGSFFVCLSRFGSWTWIKDWRTRGLVVQIAILSRFVGQFWCGFQHF